MAVGSWTKPVEERRTKSSSFPAPLRYCKEQVRSLAEDSRDTFDLAFPPSKRLERLDLYVQLSCDFCAPDGILQEEEYGKV